MLLSNFHLNSHTTGFDPLPEGFNHLVQHNKWYQRKVLLSSFHLNSHTLGFHLQTQKLERHLVQHNKQYHMQESTAQ